ncbi:MAG: dihydrolipoyl dehydrogenase [Methylacidiphilales bacterium]|nr:dihydrolipoyl dehydrogenase [Candidatus Methylacidiphilales bacterium]
MNSQKKIAVIGAGPGGYICAIRAAQLGMQVTCIDQWVNASNQPSPGGTCLNVGCIPSKVLLESTHLYHEAEHSAAIHGISLAKLSMDVAKMQDRKEKIVTNLAKGVQSLLKANNINFISGTASLGANKTVFVNDSSIGSFDAVVLASGSLPIELPFAKFNHTTILDSADALALKEVPATLGIIGAGVIGLELGSVWARLGSKVTILEALPDFLPSVDTAIAQQAFKSLSNQGMTITLNTKVTAVQEKNKKVQVTLANQEQPIMFDALIVAVGRKPNCKQVLRPESGITLNKNDSIPVDQYCRTSVSDIYAVGDLVRGPMLAHKASHEGVMVAELIAGEHAESDLNLVPSIIYTNPEIAWVGKTEKQLQQDQIPYTIGSFPFAALGRAIAQNSTTGMVKILSHKETGTLLGVHIFGPSASELIATATTALAFEATAEDIALTIAGHPTLSEAFHEAALDATTGALNLFRKKT